MAMMMMSESNFLWLFWVKLICRTRKQFVIFIIRPKKLFKLLLPVSAPSCSTVKFTFPFYAAAVLRSCGRAHELFLALRFGNLHIQMQRDRMGLGATRSSFFPSPEAFLTQQQLIKKLCKQPWMVSQKTFPPRFGSFFDAEYEMKHINRFLAPSLTRKATRNRLKSNFPVSKPISTFHSETGGNSRCRSLFSGSLPCSFRERKFICFFTALDCLAHVVLARQKFVAHLK